MSPVLAGGESGELRLTVHVQPRASRTEIVGLHGDALKIRLTTPPVGGAANTALVAFLADRLGVARDQVWILGGAGSRRKVVAITGTTVAKARQALGLA